MGCPLLDGYRHRWLRNVAESPSLATFAGCDTPEIGERLAEGDFDAVLVLGWNHKCFLQAIGAAWKLGMPVFVRGDSQLPKSPKRLKAAVKWLPYRLLLPRVSAHLFVGMRNRAYLEHYGVPERRLFFTPHAVDNERFARAATAARDSGETAAIRSALGIPPDAFVVAYAGKLLERKRVDLLIEAVHRIQQREAGTSFRLAVIGDGPLADSLAELARAREVPVAWAGFRNQSELPASYAALDGLVLPSDSEKETWGLVVNEAAACGVPSVVSDCVGCAPRHDRARSDRRDVRGRRRRGARGRASPPEGELPRAPPGGAPSSGGQMRGVLLPERDPWHPGGTREHGPAAPSRRGLKRRERPDATGDQACVAAIIRRLG